MTLAALGAGLVGSAFVICVGLCALARRWAPELGFLDRPGGHKGHAVPTPLGGGVAIWLTVVGLLGLGLLVIDVGQAWLPEAVARHAAGIRASAGKLGLIVAAATAIMIMGLVDDRVGLSWRLRLGIQFVLAGALVVFGERVTLFWPFNHPLIGGTLALFWIVGLTNAFNLLDNMDGLAGGVGLIAALLFAGAQVAVGSLFAPAVLLLLVGALAGFLVHNRNPARLFMGDAGSNFLGFLLGALTVAGTYYRYGAQYSRASVLAPLLVMAVPLYDTASVIVIRYREGRSLFQGDRRHFSHRLVERGLTPRQAVRTIDLVTLASGLGALLLHGLDALGACVVVAQSVCLLGVVAILEVSANRNERGHGTTATPIPGPSEPVGEAQGNG